MLKLSETRIAYEDASGKLSEINRQLCFAGFGVIWLYNMTEHGVVIPKELYFPGVLLIVSLMLDVSQYAYTTISWGIFYHHKNSPTKDEDEMQVVEPKCFNAPAWILFGCKIVTMAIAYLYIGNFLISKMN